MSSLPSAPPLADADVRLLNALARLYTISTAINQIGSREQADVHATLRLIVESATQLVPGGFAVIYAYDSTAGTFDPSSRVAAGARAAEAIDDSPRSAGMGRRAIQKQKRILSYDEPDLELHPVLRAHTGAQVAACAPLIVAGQAVGVLYVFLAGRQAFDPHELLMLDVLVNQAAMALFQTQRLAYVQRSLARIQDESNRLHHAGLLISSRLSLQDTLDAILAMALEVTGAEYGIFRLVDKRGQNLVTRAVASEHLIRPLVQELPIDTQSVMGWVAIRREPVLIADLRLEPWSQIYYPLDADLEMRSELAVPLIGARGQLEGVLNLESPVENAFGPRDSRLLQALATQAVIAIQEVRLLDAQLETAQLLLTEPYREVLRRLVEIACDLLNARAGTIWTVEHSHLVLQAGSAGVRPPEGAPFAAVERALRHRVPVSWSDAASNTRMLVVPILQSDADEPLGAFCVSDNSDGGRTGDGEWDTKVVTCLAHYAALAIQNDARQRAFQLARDQHAVAETFAAVGDIAANVLHQLNNKVGTIPARVQGIQDKCATAVAADPYLASNLSEIEYSAIQALAAVQTNLSHLHPLHAIRINIGDCVRAALERTTLPPGVRVELVNLDNLQVIATRHSLTMVFANLLDNAANAMGGEGCVTLRGTQHDRRVVIRVQDTGPGISPVLQDRIFELNYTRGTAQPGKLGFGLWWVKTWMTRLGGTVSVESDGLHGTTFQLVLPCDPSPTPRDRVR